jgi:hypothetical protein
MTRRTWTITIVALAVLSLAGLGSLTLARADAERADCPGKIVCPQTGELICRDRCPTIDPDRSDCPGRIVCPQTGELVCKDRCPLGAKATDKPEANDKPACCSTKQ